MKSAEEECREDLLDSIFKLSEELVIYETNANEITRWYSVMMQINEKFSNKMEELINKK